jgi:uncharacterized protein (TIGR03790 family)
MGCPSREQSPPPTTALEDEVTLADALPPRKPSEVLVVINSRSEDSKAIAAHYLEKRGIPAENVCTVSADTKEQVALAAWEAEVKAPVRECLSKRAYEFIVVTKGLPLRTDEGPWGGFSTDALLVTMDMGTPEPMTVSPYFQKDERFSHAKTHMYLVNRLDGYRREHVLRMIDDAIAARPRKGPFLLHTAADRSSQYKIPDDALVTANAMLEKKGLHSVLDRSSKFPGGYTNLMGYFSWGDNDPKYDAKAYHSLRFAPGSIADTFVSTSGRTLSNPADPGQSLIGDLIEQGVTGCKGYVSEPSARSFALADVALERYTHGYSFAEAMYMASRFIQYKDMVIGDPLMAPYSR